MNELRNLVERSRRGDVEAFAEIVRRFQDMAHGYAYSLLGDFHWAEDAAQEAFIEAYRRLADLRDARAFPGWFRRIVATQCARLRRSNPAPAIPIEEAVGIAAEGPDPAQAAQRSELRSRVTEVIRSLPEKQREATALFYINGYSVDEVADFLEASPSAIKKRLHDARNTLRGRMMDMVEETLKHNAPDERFSKKVVAELMARPRPLEIEGHPVRQVADLIRAALPEYEEISADEAINKSDALIPESLKETSYHVDEHKILRTQMSDVTIRAMAGRKPPVRLIAAGRTFRPCRETPIHANVFHQIEVLTVDKGADSNAMKATLRKAVEAVLGPVELEWQDDDFHWWTNCLGVFVKTRDRKQLQIAGSGLIRAEALRENGFDPNVVSGFGFGIGLERLAMIRLGLDDVRKLWQPPYVP